MQPIEKLKKYNNMKTLKQILLLSGIIFGITIIFNQSSLADVTEEKSEKKEQKKSIGLNQLQLKSIEINLIENYLQENNVCENLFNEAENEQAFIYTMEGNCIFIGEKGAAKDLIKRSDFLFKIDNRAYYLAIN